MPRLIAVDLGSYQVKITSWRMHGRSELELEDRVAVAVPQGGVHPTLDARLAALDALLDEHPSLAAAPSDRTVFALPGELASYHRLTLPFSDKAQIEKTLRFALEAEVPYDLDDMVVGWRVVRSGPTSDVLTVSTRHDVLKLWISALAQRSLDPERVYVDTELLGSLTGGPALGAGAVAVIDVGHTHTAVALVIDGQVTWCRTVSVAGHTFTRAIQNQLQCEWSEAEARKHGTWAPEHGDDEITDPGGKLSGYAKLPDDARQAMDGGIGLFLAELRSTLLRAEDELGVEVSEVRIAGAGASFKELWDYVAADLGVAVRPATPADGEIVPAGWSVSHSGSLALMGRGSDRATDLRLGDLAYRGGTDLLRAALVYGSAGAAFFAFAAVVVFAFQYRSLMVEQRASEDQVQSIVAGTFPEAPTFDETSTAVAYMREFTAEAVQRAELLGEGAGAVPPTVDALARLTSAFPDHNSVTVSVDHLTIAPQSIQFDAETDGYASSAAVEESLQGSTDFSGATKEDRAKKTNKLDFAVTIPLNGAAGEGG